MNYKIIKNTIMNEINQVLDSFNDFDIENFIKIICAVKKNNGKICGFGAGRMGYGLRAFMMRLNHIGITANFIGDTFNPPLNVDDLFIVTSGSGETKSVLKYLEIAKKKGVPTLAITGNSESSMAKLANYTITFKSSNGGLNSSDNDKKINSIQPMTALNEQSMFVFFDIVTVLLMKELGIQKADEKKFHFNIE